MCGCCVEVDVVGVVDVVARVVRDGGGVRKVVCE